MEISSTAPRRLIAGPIASTLLMFALPMLATSVLQSLNSSINAIWIGQFLGEKALAATSNANLVVFLMFAAMFGFSMASTVIIGQKMGRGDLDGIRRTMGTAVGISFFFSIIVALLGWLCASAVLRLLATPADVFPLALSYLRMIFLSVPAIFITVLISMGLRGAGDSMTPLWFMMFSAVIDCGLNPLFILGVGPFPELGIAGSALATAIANYASLAGLILYIYGRDLTLRLRGAEWRYLWPDPVLLRAIVAKGIPMGLHVLVLSTSALTMIGLVNREGTETVAAYGAVNQLWTYIQMPAIAIGAAVSTMVAQNIGAGRWDRVSRIASSGVLINLLLTGGLVLLVILVDRHALSLFLGSHEGAIERARHINLVVSWSFIFYGMTVVLAGVLRANGAVIVPLIIMVIVMFPVRFGLAYTFQPHFGADAIWWSFPAGMAALLLLTAGYYHWGSWRTAKLLVPSLVEAEEQALADCEPGGRIRPTV